ncbi:hypothetical protein MRX96_029482 [Rhipicephalus microplus]
MDLPVVRWAFASRQSIPVLPACQKRHVLQQSLLDCLTNVTRVLRGRRVMQGFGSMSVAPRTKLEPSGNPGITTDLLSGWGPFSVNRTRPQLKMVRKKWHKESYLAISAIYFTMLLYLVTVVDYRGNLLNADSVWGSPSALVE